MRITSLTITFNMRTVNVILIKLIIVVKVYLTNTVTKIQFGREKKKACWEKVAGKLTTTTTNNYV